MISETSICNQALSYLGTKRITSIDEASRTAEHCRDHYPFVRDAVIEDRYWSFARARDISTVNNKDAFSNLFAHPMPQEWLQVFYVHADACETPVHWEREGRFILCDASTVYMKGVRRVVDTGFFSNMFVQTLATRLAADLAIPITENRNLQADYWNLYGVKLSQAAARDGMQGKNVKLKSSSLIDARRR